MRVLRVRRAATLIGVLTAAALVTLIGATQGEAATPVTAATPAPNPTATAGSKPPPPLIAGRPAGSSTSGALIGIRADDGARVIAMKRLDKRTVDITVRSPAVGADVPVRIIVPPGWSRTSAKTWPLALALHGGNDNWTSWTRKTDIEKLSSSWGVLIAMPEAGRTAAYTDYFQKTAQGPLKWETFHTVELMQILDRGFRTSQQRAVIGISGGGYGAMAYAGRHPGMFTYAASYSGMLGVNQFPLQQAVLAGDQEQGTGSARYGLPIINQQNWDAHDPYKLINNYRGTGLYIYSGLTGIPSEADTVGWGPVQIGEAWIGIMNQSFVGDLNRSGIPVTSHFSFAGEHDWASWKIELHTSWPLIMKSIGAKHI